MSDVRDLDRPLCSQLAEITGGLDRLQMAANQSDQFAHQLRFTHDPSIEWTVRRATIASGSIDDLILEKPLCVQETRDRWLRLTLVKTFGNLVAKATAQYSSKASVFFVEKEYRAAELNEVERPEVDESVVLIVTSISESTILLHALEERKSTFHRCVRPLIDCGVERDAGWQSIENPIETTDDQCVVAQIRLERRMEMTGLGDIELMRRERFQGLLQLRQLRLLSKEDRGDLVFDLGVFEVLSHRARLDPEVDNVRNGPLVVLTQGSRPVDQL